MTARGQAIDKTVVKAFRVLELLAPAVVSAARAIARMMLAPRR